MNTAIRQQAQKIQLTLTSQEMQVLAIKGQSLGYDPVKFIKFLISREVYSFLNSIPIYHMSADLEKATKITLDDYTDGKLKSYDTIDNLLKDL